MKPVLAMATLISFALLSCKDKTGTYTVNEKRLNEAVYASGKIMPQAYDLLQTSAPEHILTISAEEGTMVKKGQPLVILGASSQNEQLKLLLEQVNMARQNASENSASLQQLEAQISLAEQKYQQDASNAQGYKELAKDQAVSQQDADNAALQAKTSLTEYQHLQQQYKVRKTELTNNFLDVQRQLTQFKQQRSEHILLSTMDGKVLSINLKEGELAKPDESILLIGTEDKFKLELLVDERDIRKIAMGQKVLFETDAFAGKQFHGKISSINPVLQQESRSFKVEAEVLDSAGFYPQSSVEANIIIREAAMALMIPSAYLLPGDSVWVQPDAGETRKVKVETGVENDNWIEIKSGLEKETVILNRQ